MTFGTKRYFFLPLLILTISASLSAKEIKGIVFEDSNKNLKLDPGEAGVAGVLVSNQRDVVQTDARGQYSIPIDDATIIFITKPADYITPVSEHQIPQFYYIHQPKGSPALKFEGIKPTGNAPKSLNFPLFKTEPIDTFSVIVFSDPQPKDHQQIDYIRDDVVSELIGTSAVCGITLGDIVFDDLSLYDRSKQIISQIGIPFYNVPGNHDENYDSLDDRFALETFKRHFGPNYYSFDYGQVHFIVLDVVEYLGRNEKGSVQYQGRIGAKQLQWLTNDLNFIPPDRLVVLTLHIPLYTSYGDDAGINVIDRTDLFEALKNRPHLLALAGHMHTLEHAFIGRQHGWEGEKPLHQVICAAVCGTWWTGLKDERGIPIADQRDGTPNGYHIFNFRGNQFDEIFKPASRSVDFQLRISSPLGKIAHADLQKTQIIVNVFDGSEKSVVQFQLDEFDFQAMQHTRQRDPFYERIYDQVKNEVPTWISPDYSTHIWTAPMPADLKPGVHKIVAKTIDQFGRTFQAMGIFEVE